MEQREEYIDDHGIALHIKFDIPDHTGLLPVMVLFHGFTGNMEEESLLEVRDAGIQAGCAVLRAELYGHGKSGGEFKDHTILNWIENAEAVIAYAKQQPFVSDLVPAGHSQGGLMVILLGAKHPADYKGLLLLSPGVSIPDDMRNGSLLGEHFDPNHIPETIDTWENQTLSGNYIRVMKEVDPYVAARAYPGNVGIIHGGEDEVIPVDYAKRLATEYAHAELRIIEGDDHNYNRHREVMAQAAGELLRKLIK